MRVELVAYTQQNPVLTPDAVAGLGDLSALWESPDAFPERLIEYAGRVCYRSTHRMGTAPEFTAARVREGHEDIIEHVVVTLHFLETEEPASWRLHNRHCEISEVGREEWLVSGNTRVWLDFFRAEMALAALPYLAAIAPKVFDEFKEQLPADFDAQQLLAGANNQITQPIASSAADQLHPAHQGAMRVTLLGVTQPVLKNPASLLHHGAATFLFEGISRTCTHQLVRHRLASFSQESQRYVDLSKGGWRAIVPDAVAARPEAIAELDEFWRMAEEKYARLRELGIRKEDARFLLPNAAETRIITTMNFAAWSHFLWLRAVDKAAQWEIRAMGQWALKMLYAIAPTVFQDHWDVYQEKFVRQP
ncbi:MAG: FAD-dependent thymidylate synthase [Litorilinea sp.]